GAQGLIVAALAADLGLVTIELDPRELAARRAIVRAVNMAVFVAVGVALAPADVVAVVLAVGVAVLSADVTGGRIDAAVAVTLGVAELVAARIAEQAVVAVVVAGRVTVGGTIGEAVVMGQQRGLLLTSRKLGLVALRGPGLAVAVGGLELAVIEAVDAAAEHQRRAEQQWTHQRLDQVHGCDASKRRRPANRGTPSARRRKLGVDSPRNCGG